MKIIQLKLASKMVKDNQIPNKTKNVLSRKFNTPQKFSICELTGELDKILKNVFQKSEKMNIS